MAGILTNLGTVAGSEILRGLFNRIDLGGERGREKNQLAELQESLPAFQEFAMANRARERAIAGGADPNSLAAPQAPQLPMSVLTGKGGSILTELLGFGADNPLGATNNEVGKQRAKTTGGNAREAFKQTLNQGQSQTILDGGQVSQEDLLAGVNALAETKQGPIRVTNDRSADRQDSRARFTQGQQNFRQGRALENAAQNRFVQRSGQKIQKQNANTNAKRLQAQIDGKIGGSSEKDLSGAQKKSLVEQALGEGAFIDEPIRDQFGDPVEDGSVRTRKSEKLILQTVKKTNQKAKKHKVTFEQALQIPDNLDIGIEAVNQGDDPAEIAERLGITLEEFETLANRSFAR